tara:strand:+ start:306 stop:1070 length:765 start_codon:yes stop_codon:yes gene_type:complete
MGLRIRSLLSILINLFLLFTIGCLKSDNNSDSNENIISNDFRRCAIISETIVNPISTDLPNPTIIWDGRVALKIYQVTDDWFDTLIFHFDNYGNLIKEIDIYDDSIIYTYIDYWKLVSKVQHYPGSEEAYPHNVTNWSWDGLIMTDENGNQTVFNEYGKVLQDSEWSGGAKYTYLEDKRRLKSVIRDSVHHREYIWDGLDYEMIETYNVLNITLNWYGKINEYGHDIQSMHQTENSRYVLKAYDCEIFDPIPID